MTTMNRQDKTLLILGILSSHQSHGYELYSLLSSPMMPIHVGKANAYQILGRFEKDGWVTVTEEREGNRPPRRVYSLTTSGEEAFQRILRERLASHTTNDHADAVSLNFLSLIPTEEAVKLLSERLEAVQQKLDSLAEQVTEDAAPHYGVGYLLDHTVFERDWLQGLINRLASQT